MSKEDLLTRSVGNQHFTNNIFSNENSKGRVVYMRSPYMKVGSETNICRGADCIFICDSVEGNNFLRECENFKHDSWSRKNYEERGNSPSIVAHKALKAIKDFIKYSVSEELRQGAMDVEQVSGLEKILTISTPKDSDDESKRDQIVDLENIFNKEKTKKNKEKDDVKKPYIRKTEKKKGRIDSDGRLKANGGDGSRRKTGNGITKPGSRDSFKESAKGKTGIYTIPVDVSYRTWCQIDEDGKVWHLIRIFSDSEVSNAIIQVYGVDEEGKSLGLNIVEVDGYEICEGDEFTDNTDYKDSDVNSKSITKQVNNAIRGVHINANIPLTIKIRFNSDIKYSLRINSDKIVSDESK